MVDKIALEEVKGVNESVKPYMPGVPESLLGYYDIFKNKYLKH